MARLSANDWVVAAVEQLATGGVGSVRVEPLAKKLGVSKGSFYWHFEDRRALLSAVLDGWEKQGTLRIIEDVDREQSEPRARLWALFERIFGAPIAYDGFEASIRAWAGQDPDAKRVVRRVDRRRLSYVARLLVDAGVDPEEAERRSEVLYCTLIGEFLQRTYGKPRLADATLRSLHAMLLGPRRPG